MKSRFVSIAVILLLLGIVIVSSIKVDAKEKSLRVDAVFQEFAPENLSTEYNYRATAKELSEFSISLPENKCCIIISENTEVYENCAYTYLGFMNDIYYFEEVQ